MGPSGAGKTTLVKLLVGLYRPKWGHIYYNGVPEDEVEIEDLRERIGFVTQDAQLFSGSIRENLLLFAPMRQTPSAWTSCGRHPCRVCWRGLTAASIR